MNNRKTQEEKKEDLKPVDDTATGEGRTAETDEKNRGIAGNLDDINPNKQSHKDV